MANNLTFKKLVHLVNNGNSVRCEIHHHRIDRDKNTKKITYEHKHIDKQWQLEKQNEQYCYKTFDCYDKAQKQFFTPFKEEHKQGVTKIFRDIKSFVTISREDMIETFGVNSDWFPLRTDLDKDENKISEKVYKYSWANVTETTEIKFKHFKTRKMTGGKVHKNGEENIRVELDKYIKEMYPDEPTKDEFSTAALKTRADTVVFTKKGIHVFEIKSEKDSFARLENQINDYKTYAEKITIVLHAKKLNAFIKNHIHLFDKIGLMVYYGRNVPLEVKIKPKKLHPSSKRFNLLWSKELSEILKEFKVSSKVRNSQDRVTVLGQLFTKAQTHKIINAILHDRYLQKQQSEKSFVCGCVPLDNILPNINSIKEKLHKKTLNIIRKKL